MPWNRLKIEQSPLFLRVIQPVVGTFIDAVERVMEGCK